MVMRGIVYFGLVFSAGFLLGVVRVLWLVPLVGDRLAELAEAPLMLVVIVLSARLVVRRFPASRSGHLASGVLALIVLVVVEFSVVLGVRGLSISQYLAERDPIAGSVYLLMLLVFAVMPRVLATRRGEP
ncbi:MAG: hypothetical protein PVH91_01885 [Pseudomonadales bacterium]|jgi:hypothetical protein